MRASYHTLPEMMRSGDKNLLASHFSSGILDCPLLFPDTLMIPKTSQLVEENDNTRV